MKMNRNPTIASALTVALLAIRVPRCWSPRQGRAALKATSLDAPKALRFSAAVALCDSRLAYLEEFRSP
jgi:hypothetical protein